MLDAMPVSDVGERICKLFSYKWKTIERSADTESAEWSTNSFPMRPRSLWNRYQDAATIIGVRFGTLTSYAMIDIDHGGNYHTAEGLEAILGACEIIGLVRSIVVRSSWSGGWHVYFPLPENVSSFSLACTIKNSLESQGIAIAPGHCEIFPNLKPYARPWEITEYNGHRLPLQPGSGSCLLDKNLMPTAGNLERFLWSWDYASSAQDMDLFIPALEIGRNLERKRKKRSNSKLAQFSADLRIEIEQGWTGPGQTNSLLKAFAAYGRIFESLADDELSLYIEQMAYTRQGYQVYCNHQRDIPKKAKAWARWATRFYWPANTTPTRELGITSPSNLNEERREDARKRIIQAMTHLAQTNCLAATVTSRLSQLCKLAQTSAQTLYKNLDLWHPDQWCVMPRAASDTAPKTDCKEKHQDRLKPLVSGALHTLPPLLRCVPLTDALKNSHSRGMGGVPGGGGGSPQAFQGS